MIIGYGSIGQRCGELLARLGLEVHALRRDVSRPSPHARRVFTPAQRLEALAGADHVVCVLPSDTGTDRFLDAEAIACLPSRAVVYNLGRGNAIDIEALCDALARGRIAGAFLDVVPEEPLAVTFRGPDRRSGPGNVTLRAAARPGTRGPRRRRG